MIVHLLYKKCSAFLTLPVPACPKGKLLYKCAKTTKKHKKTHGQKEQLPIFRNSKFFCNWSRVYERFSILQNDPA